MRTDERADKRRDIVQLTVTFLNFANEPKNCSDYAENVGRHRKKKKKSPTTRHPELVYP
jgi:hypothetical protein